MKIKVLRLVEFCSLSSSVSCITPAAHTLLSAQMSWRKDLPRRWVLKPTGIRPVGLNHSYSVIPFPGIHTSGIEPRSVSFLTLAQTNRDTHLCRNVRNVFSVYWIWGISPPKSEQASWINCWECRNCVVLCCFDGRRGCVDAMIVRLIKLNVGPFLKKKKLHKSTRFPKNVD